MLALLASHFDVPSGRPAAVRTRAARVLAGLAAMAAMLGCSPAYDWRSTGAERGYTALLPARPQSQTRTLPLFGQSIELTLTSAETQGQLFAIGDAQLSPALAAPEQREAVLQAFEDALLRKLQGTLTRRAPLHWNGTPAPEAGRDIEALGQTADGERHLVARLLIRGERFYELIVIGAPKSLPADAIETFLDGFRLAR